MPSLMAPCGDVVPHHGSAWSLVLRLACALILLWAPAEAVEPTTSTLFQRFLDEAQSGTAPVLPDYSYAGYAAGERPIPTPVGPVFDVTTFGAIPGSNQPAYPGIQRAIDACEAAGGGVVWFPKGIYQVNPLPADATAPRLRIRGDHVILRGAGSGLDGTVLFMEAEIQPQDPQKMWSGRPVLLVAPEGRGRTTMVAEVHGSVAMNQRHIPVKEGHDLHPGDRISVVNSVPVQDLSVLERRIAPHPWNPGWKNGLHLREHHLVERVQANAILLREGVLTPMAADQTWTIERTNLQSEVGIEGIRFVGNWHEKFVHHQDWRHDSAWRGVTMSRIEDSWIRDCVFEDMNWPIQLIDARNCTTERLTFSGTPGHFGIQCTSSTNILNLEVRDEAGHFHGPSIQNGSAGIVYHRALWREQGCLDSHAGASYASLFELGTGGLEVGACGGAFSAFPHHLHACVVWNHTQTSTTAHPQEFWSEVMNSSKKSFLEVLLVGLSGPRPDLRQVAYEESTGVMVEPRSLWLAQLQHRLGKLPDHWVNALPRLP